MVVHPFTREDTAHGNSDSFYFDGANRERIDDARDDWLIDGLVPIGAMVVFADPGAGKSFLVQQWLHHLAYGRPLGPWGTQCPGGHLVRVFDLEGWWRQTQDRSYAITPYGVLPQDGRPDRNDNYLAYSTMVIPASESEVWAELGGSQAARHSQYLRVMLGEAREAGQPIRCVVIDTLTKFVGPKPRSAAGNAYEYEAQVIDYLNRMALDFQCSIILIHHTNKAGELSGSQGIGGSATVTARLRLEERTEEEITDGVPAKGVLVSTKVRAGEPFCYALEQRSDGVWEFVDRPPSETEAAGNARAVLSALASGPRTKAELLRLTGLASSLPRTLTRMRARGLIFSRYGQWHMVRDDRRTMPGQADGRCSVCGGPMTVVATGQDRHPGCSDVGSEQPAEDGGRDQDAAEPEPGPAARSAYAMLMDSVERSRMKPVVRVRKSLRDGVPWSLVTEVMTGEHEWAVAQEIRDGLDASAPVVVLDRRGSYPSAMGSVPLVANVLQRTGAWEGPVPKSTGGLFLVAAVPWSPAQRGIGHPLGRIARPVPSGGPSVSAWWVTTPHLRLLERLAQLDVVPEPRILDSWTGRVTGGLFTAFSREVQQARESAQVAGDEERYAQVKRATSVAIRGLWPKQARSPFWRPDWSVTVRAEAAVRHWIRAWQAVEAGVRVLKVGRVDEVALVAEQVPAPYVEGTRYGQVSVKWAGTFGEWAADRANRER